MAAFDGFPNTEGFRPEVTFVSQPSYELGYKGAQLAVQRIRGELPAKRVHYKLEPSLNVRESTLAFPGVRKHVA